MSLKQTGILDRPLVFVDIETNGLNHLHGSVIEVAAIRVESGVITSSYHSLVNPCSELPRFITNLTGITTSDVQSAPSFEEIAEELQQVLQGAVFVAHNVRFDYSFLKQEFSRIGIPFLPKQLCTVKLSRSLYPHEKGHKLQDLIRRHNFSFTERHRAYDDAAVLWQFVQHIVTNFPPEQINAAIAKQLKQPSLPKSLEPEIIRNLPERPGVYIFENAAGQPLYVGKSINIKQRVLSHFSRDHADGKEFKIAQTIERIRTEQTAGELSALLRESQLVKDLQPLYNRRLRRLSKLVLAKQVVDEAGYSIVRLVEATGIDPMQIADILAVYSTRGRARESLNSSLKLYELCPKLLGLEKSSGACFLYQLKKCRGACIGLESSTSYNLRLQLAFERLRLQAWPYGGPILVEEKLNQAAADTTKHGLVIDQWCVVAEIEQEEYCEPVIRPEAQNFDLDTYKILHSFLTAKRDKLKIQRLPYGQLQALGLGL